MCCGSVRYWALTASVVLHAGILAVFTGVQLSRGGQDVRPQRSAVAMQAIERVTETPKPVPKVKPIEVPAPEPVKEPEPTLVKDRVPEPVLAPAPAPAPMPVLPAPILTETKRSSAPVQTPTNEVEFFGQKSVVQRICYVVDCSGSMYGRMYRVKDQLRQSILKLTGDQAFSVIFFKDGRQVVMSGSGRLERATAAAKSQALNLIASVRPEGTTDALHALEAAMRLKGPDGRGAEVFYFLTDGFDFDAAGSQDFSKSVLGLRRKLAPRSTLHTIAFSPQAQDRQMLQTLATSTGGGFVEVDSF
jgi:hypothetical protein